MRAVVARASGTRAELDDEVDEGLLTGAVGIDVAFSSLNYKDGLALAGRPGVVRQWPLIVGIDTVGTVSDSTDPGVTPGDLVVLNGSGHGEVLHGGYAEKVRTAAGALVRVPAAFTAEQAAAVGTAGFTSMLCVLALEDGGVRPDDGEILVTGAAGGVGSVAISLLARRGYTVVASTGRAREQEGYLRDLGAAEVIDRGQFSEAGGRPLQQMRWAGVVDSVGSTTLANVLSQTRYGGTVAACGLAQGPDLPATVLPFILRSVTLRGIDSVYARPGLRQRAWNALAAELDLGLLDGLSTVVGMNEVVSTADRILAGQVRGRTVVDVHR